MRGFCLSCEDAWKLMIQIVERGLAMNKFETDVGSEDDPLNSLTLHVIIGRLHNHHWLTSWVCPSSVDFGGLHLSLPDFKDNFWNHKKIYDIQNKKKNVR